MHHLVSFLNKSDFTFEDSDYLDRKYGFKFQVPTSKTSFQIASELTV